MEKMWERVPLDNLQEILNRPSIYKTLVGSPVYNLCTGGSDRDVAIVLPQKIRRRVFFPERVDLIPFTPESFIEGSTKLNHRGWAQHQLLYPAEFYVENNLSKWIRENREEMTRALLPQVYEAYMGGIKEFINRTPRKNKYYMYAILLRNILINYAEGMTFEEALKAQGEYRDFLLSIRNGTVDLSLLKEKRLQAHEKVKEVRGFYAEPKADLDILEEFKKQVYSEVKNLGE